MHKGTPAPGRMGTGNSDLLESGELELLGRVRWSSNATFLAKVRDRRPGGPDEVLVIYKPRRGERPLWDFPEGSLCDREVAAFEVSESLGWQVVPPTLLRDGPLGEGMVQLFVEHDPQEHYFTLQERFPERFAQIALFDFITNNADRKAGHCLLGEDGTVWGIDHGLTFHVEPKVRTVIWDYAGQCLSRTLIDDLASLRVALDGELADRLAERLARGEIVATRRRIDDLLTMGALPRPTSRSSLPWPVI